MDVCVWQGVGAETCVCSHIVSIIPLETNFPDYFKRIVIKLFLLSSKDLNVPVSHS